MRSRCSKPTKRSAASSSPAPATRRSRRVATSRSRLADDKRYSREEQDRMGYPRRTLEISVCAKPVIGMMNGLAYGGRPCLLPRST